MLTRKNLVKPSWSWLGILSVFFVPAISQAQGDAANWQTWVLKNAEQVSVAPPPGAAQTKQELALVKQRRQKADENALYQVKYWDAGAPAYRWNNLAYSLVDFHDFTTFTRVPSAWVNLAIYDATIVAWKAKNKYRRMRPAQADPSIKTAVKAPATSSYPCEHSVTAAAAAYVLAYFYPAKADSIMRLAKAASQSRIDAGLQFPSDTEAGWKLGADVAAIIIEEARKDNSDKKWTGSMKTGPGLWYGDYPVGITAAVYRPLVLRTASQFRPPAPPDFAADMKAMKEFKQNEYTISLAHHWASLSGFDIWTDLASQKIFEYRLQENAPECARIYALLHVAMHDGAIAIMDAKYAYWGIRPYQYDTAYKPLIAKPPFPGYPSGHATASSTAATVLEHFFPGDAAFFRKTAKECADSRFYAGIHFPSDNSAGLEMGKKLGDFAFETLMNKNMATRRN